MNKDYAQDNQYLAEAPVIEVTVKGVMPRNMGEGNDDRLTLLSTKMKSYIINDDKTGRSLKPGDVCLVELRGRFSSVLSVTPAKA